MTTTTNRQPNTEYRGYLITESLSEDFIISRFGDIVVNYVESMEDAKRLIDLIVAR